MSISQIGGSKENVISVPLAVANTQYRVSKRLNGSFNITCSSSIIVTVSYLDDLGNWVQKTTSSGVTDVAVSGLTFFYLNSNTANTTVLFTRTSNYASRVQTGVLDVVTSTSTYTEAGTGIVMLIGGGSGGSVGGNFSPSSPPFTTTWGGPGGAGGAGGRVSFGGAIALPGSLPITVGAGGGQQPNNQTAPSLAVNGGDSSVGVYNTASGTFNYGGNGGDSGKPPIPHSPGPGPAGSANPSSTRASTEFGVAFGSGGGASPINSGAGGGGGRAASGGGGGGGAGGPARSGGGGGGGGGGWNSGNSGGAGVPLGPGGAAGTGGNGAVCILRYT